MKILAISDWRIQPLAMLIDIVKTNKPDIILYAGDDLRRFILVDNHLLIKTQNHLLKLSYPDLRPINSKGKIQIADNLKESINGTIRQINFRNNPFKDILERLRIPIYYVYGNDDCVFCNEDNYYVRILISPLSITESSKGNISIKTNYENLKPEDMVYNYIGGIFAPMNLSYGKFKVQNNSEEITIFGVECEYGLNNKIKNIPGKYADIYLSHLPPLGILDLSARFGINHIGSKELLDSIKKYHPKLVICGHSHIWGGFSKKIGDTLVINVSSLDTDPAHGNYALIDTNDWSVIMGTKEDKNFLTIRGMRSINYRLNTKIMSAENSDIRKDLSDALENLITYRYRLIEKNKELFETLATIDKLKINTQRLQERIESFNWEKPKILRKITIDPNKHAFVDVETGLANGNIPGKLWLIGIFYKGDLRQFFYPKEKERFINYIKQNQITSLVSWTEYDMRALRPILKSEKIFVKFIDACQRTANCVTWNTYKLQEFYSVTFPEKIQSKTLIPGAIAGLYADHLIIPNKKCSHCPSKDMIIEQIKEKNKVDILQMIEICNKLWTN